MRLATATLLKGIAPSVGIQLESNRLNALARKYGVDFWILLPHGNVYPPPDSPYMYIVWDMQGRLQPWFPEVSARGVWETSETINSSVIRRASILVTGSERCRSEIEFFYNVPRDRIYILKMPTPELPDIDFFPEKIRHNVPKPFIVYPANFWPHKNHVNLLYALKDLRERHGLDLNLVLTGRDRGNLVWVRKAVNELGLEDFVTFTGFISTKELVWLYKQAFALAFVSFFGPDNLPPLEAFACGCPVLAADAPGVREQLGEAAVLVRPESPSEISDALAKIHADKDLRDEMIAKGYEVARTNRAETFVAGVFELLDSFEPIRRCWGI
jgi:glycosyltransferase involved in cell wall biosynthesis